MAAGKVSRRSPRVLSSADKPSLSHENGNGDDTVVELVDFDLESEEEPEKKKQKVQEKLKSKTPSSKKNKKNPVRDNSWLIGEPVPGEEARQRWPDRYNKKKNGKKGRDSASEKPKGDDGEEIILNVRCHYTQAEVDGCIYDINDCAYVKGEDGGPDYIGRIIEFFETTDRQQYFTAQWFFKAQDTVIKEHCNFHDQKRVFYSDLKDDNLLECIISKLNIVQVSPNVDLEAKEKLIPSCDYYYDMSYSLQYSTFSNLLTESSITSSNTSSTISSETPAVATTAEVKSDSEESSLDPEFRKSDLALLDLYSGCGGMSTGLSLGAKLSGVNLVTRWAIDLNEHACQSLKLNHPETEVRNETADGFLTLLKEWEKLCKRFSVFGMDRSQIKNSKSFDKDDEEAEDNSKVPPDEFEIGKLVGICYGDPSNIGKDELKFKVRWKGYGPSDDTWEPIEGLSKCHEKIREFVRSGYKSHILPFPGDVDVICGGPPCQGISGFNRFRNVNAPLDDPKNHQMVVFMDIVNYLKPKYVLMENVVDILKFAGGFLGRYALSRLVHMNYQARLGMMAAGCYGLPQFRMRVFLWGARPTEKLPQYPLPTHDVVVRGGVPNEFERNVVAYDEDQPRKLEKALLLGDAISDLPPVTNSENRDEMPYGKAPRTDFQRYIRSLKHDSISCTSDGKRTPQKAVLFDHKPLKLNDDDYLRVCRIPKRKSANFRDLPGVLVGADNIVEWDPKVERVLLPSGKPLVPDYAMTFVKGRSSKPFGRLWWDETVPTVVTRAEPHNQAILHPEQDRVLSIRENARLQGFPDCYKLCGPVKERYTQVGNAVAVPVARALGYALGMSYQGMSGDGPLMTLPQRFPQSLQRVSSATIEEHS